VNSSEVCMFREGKFREQPQAVPPGRRPRRNAVTPGCSSAASLLFFWGGILLELGLFYFYHSFLLFLFFIFSISKMSAIKVHVEEKVTEVAVVLT